MFDQSKEFRVQRGVGTAGVLFGVMDEQQQRVCAHGTELLKATPRMKTRSTAATLLVANLLDCEDRIAG
jgi:hypothetical protein